MAASGEILSGTLAGLVSVGIAAERASFSSGGPGSFSARFLDELASLKPEDFLDSGKRINIEEVNG
jgi:hydroxyethylthiazole kinase-like sugar kinase family protein